LRTAMAGYFEEIYRDIRNRIAAQGRSPSSLTPELFANMLNRAELAAFLDQLQNNALVGARDAARRMLSQLQQTMDRIDPSLSTQMPPQVQALMEDFSAMRDLIRRQEDLLARTKEESDHARRQEPPTYPPPLPLDQDRFGAM